MICRCTVAFLLHWAACAAHYDKLDAARLPRENKVASFVRILTAAATLISATLLAATLQGDSVALQGHPTALQGWNAATHGRKSEDLGREGTHLSGPVLEGDGRPEP